MPKKAKWYTSVWKVIVVLSVIFSLVTSMLQVFGAIDFLGLVIFPFYTFFTSSVSIYYVVLLIVVLVVLSYSVTRFRGHGHNVLDWDYGRWLAELCNTPRTTDYLRNKYEEWESQSSFVGGMGFDDYMKRLEKQGYLKYRNGEWEVTDKALDYIDKYHGS